MNTKLTDEQLGELVAEVERLSDRRQGELDRKQVEDILQELNLPTDLLDEALVQLRRREALEVPIYIIISRDLLRDIFR